MQVQRSRAGDQQRTAAMERSSLTLEFGRRKATHPALAATSSSTHLDKPVVDPAPPLLLLLPAGGPQGALPLAARRCRLAAAAK